MNHYSFKYEIGKSIIILILREIFFYEKNYISLNHRKPKERKVYKMALVTAERLHRWKCIYCGSKDKNISSIKVLKEKGLSPSDGENYQEGCKIVACNQCGHVELFAHSSKMFSSIIAGNPCTIEESEEFVQKFHDVNHLDPKVNPHN